MVSREVGQEVSEQQVALEQNNRTKVTVSFLYVGGHPITDPVGSGVGLSDTGTGSR